MPAHQSMKSPPQGALSLQRKSLCHEKYIETETSWCIDINITINIKYSLHEIFYVLSKIKTYSNIYYFRMMGGGSPTVHVTCNLTCAVSPLKDAHGFTLADSTTPWFKGFIHPNYPRLLYWQWANHIRCGYIRSVLNHIKIKSTNKNMLISMGLSLSGLAKTASGLGHR